MVTEKALINQIIPASAVDGPGNRTVIFFQQCNFNCGYCHNPETIHPCSHCGDCIAVCPAQALSLVNGRVQWDPAVCVGCDSCLAACRQLSSPKARLLSVEEVLAAVRSSLPFIRGITVSGGECTLQRGFLLRLLQGARALGLATLIDSNGSYDFAADAELLRHTDGVMLDIKATDPAAHHDLTGVGNAMVLKNAVLLAKQNKLPEVRTVVVPGWLPNEQTVTEVARLLGPYAVPHGIRYKLIKYRPVGVRPEHAGYAVPGDDLMRRLRRIALAGGFHDVLIV